MRISDEYKRLNAQLHKERGGYGSKGGKWAPRLIALAKQVGARSILDYGCGKGSLKREIQALTDSIQIFEYDPAIEGKDALPGRADLVVCCDVLEHVEPECIDAVIRHIVDLSNKATMVAVACRPGKRILANGASDHLTVQPPIWWAKRLRRFGEWQTIPSLRDREHCAALRK